MQFARTLAAVSFVVLWVLARRQQMLLNPTGQLWARKARQVDRQSSAKRLLGVFAQKGFEFAQERVRSEDDELLAATIHDGLIEKLRQLASETFMFLFLGR